MGGRGRPKSPGLLTPREAEVLDRVARGKTNREIAAELGISEQGVKYHLNEVYSKTGLASREELIAWRRERRLGLRLGPVWVGIERVAALAGVGGLALLAMVISMAPFGSNDPGGAKPTGNNDDAGASDLPACAAGAVIIPAGTQVTCVADIDAAQRAVGFDLLVPPDWRDAMFLSAATTRGPDGRGVFLRYEVDGERVDFLEGDFPSDFSINSEPFQVTNASFGWMGFFTFGTEGAVFHWCTLYDLEFGVAMERCRDRVQGLVHGMAEADLEKLVYDIVATHEGLDWHSQGLAAEPTPVPLPARGTLVEPLFLVPVFPGAREIDGFSESDGGITWRIQTYETDQRLEDVLAWYQQDLESSGWQALKMTSRGKGRGVVGQSAIQTVVIQTFAELFLYVDGYPPGFRGENVPSEHRFNGKWVFWVMTTNAVRR